MYICIDVKNYIRSKNTYPSFFWDPLPTDGPQLSGVL